MADTGDQAAQYWRQALAASDQLAFVIDTQRTIVAVSGGMARLSGAEPGALVGHTCAALMHAGSAPAECPLRELLLDEGAHEGEVFSEVLDSHLFVTVTPLPDASGRVTHVLHVASNISDRKRMEAALRESEGRFAALFKDAPLGYQSLDEEGRFVVVNPMWLETLGYEEHEVIGRWFGDFLAPQYVEAFRERFPLFKARGEIHSEFEMVRKDGQRRFIAFEGRIGHNTDGSFRQTHCILADITERVRAEAKLRENEARYRSLFENSPVAMWEEDDSLVKAYLEQLAADGIEDVEAYLREHPEAYVRCAELARGVDANQAAVQLFEARDRDELLARNSDLYRGVDDRGVVAFWMAILRGEPTATFEEVNVSLAGRRLHVLETCTVVPGHESSYDRVYVADVDITRRKAAEQALARREQLLRNAERLAHLGSWEWEAGSDQIAVSEELARILGTTATRLTRDEMLRRIHREDVAMLEECADAMQADAPAFSLVTRVVRGDDGRMRHVAVAGEAEYARDGRLKRICGAALDVTEAAENQQELHRQKESLERMLTGTVRALATAVEMRDPYTAGHQQRVAELAVALAEHLGWPASQVDDVRIAALLHDIGKVVVPAEILTKPSTLTSSEFELIKAHVAAATEILAPVEFNPVVHQAVAQHHERLNGSGYPHGLRGDEISPEGRVLAVADVYEAMVSHRPYRPALPESEAQEELQGGAGTKYDAAVVDCCVAVVNSGFAFTNMQT